MKNLWLSSLFLLCISCATSKPIRWTEEADGTINFKAYFDSVKTAKYKTEVNAYGRKVSGVLFVKYTNDTTCRVAFTTIPGSTLFSMQLTPATDTVYECIAQMNKEVVLNVLKKNIRTFIMLDNFTDSPQSFTSDTFNGIMWRRNSKEELYQYYQPIGEQVNKIELCSKNSHKKIELVANGFEGSLPSEVFIKNCHIKLSLHLTKL